MSLSEISFRHCLNKLYNYTKKWKLHFYLTENQIDGIFNKSGRKLKLDYMFGQTKVEMAISYTYLGCVLTPSGSFSANQEYLYKKGQSVLFSFLKDFNHRRERPCGFSLNFLIH